MTLLSICFILNVFANMYIPVFIPFSIKSTCFCGFFFKSSKWFFKWSGCFWKTIGMFWANHTDESGKSFRWFCRTNWNRGKGGRKKALERPLKTILTPYKPYREALLELTFWRESTLSADTLIHSSAPFRFSSNRKITSRQPCEQNDNRKLCFLGLFASV